jgi:hypothetical protein
MHVAAVAIATQMATAMIARQDVMLHVLDEGF